MPYFLGLRLWSQSSQNDQSIEDCDYDRSHHKMIASLFLRIAIMIAVLIKCTIYEDCDHDCSPHKKMSCFWVFIGLRSWLQFFLLGQRPWSQYSQKCLNIWVFMRTETMITVLLTKCPIFEFSWGPRLWSQSSQNALFLSQSSQRTTIMSLNLISVSPSHKAPIH